MANLDINSFLHFISRSRGDMKNPAGIIINPPAQSVIVYKNILYRSFVAYLSNTVLSTLLFLAKYGGFVNTNLS
ncbi:hypothetical protein NY2A_b015R [Paramecium bursaria Chlorella virus NY2A]|uniref:Uncharacterized protein b015R n=1 Tax=Paramecium bursaria Chlorella virus NY2A TaxID=46021 RepID=A7IVP0_PBCVN|nr:hypothetical protein NY2A_b015R [Paramecium bursaria Chlorella virus NY2A]ABT14414.1 hypothetical protein NY2A_b015R [Paramecium bursaria Chlorella virus NY2A]